VIAKFSVGFGEWLRCLVYRKDLKLNSKMIKLNIVALERDQDLVRSQGGNFIFFRLSG